MKPAANYFTRVTTRPYGAQQQWDRHVQRRKTGSVAWRMFKVLLVSAVVLFGLMIATVPLAFG